MGTEKEGIKAAKSELGHNSRFNWRGMLAYYGTAAAVALATGLAADKAKEPTVLDAGTVTAQQRDTMASDPRTRDEKLRNVPVHESAKCKANPKLCEQFTNHAAKPEGLPQAQPPLSPTEMRAHAEAEAARAAAQTRLAQSAQSGTAVQAAKTPTHTWQELAAARATDMGLGLGVALLISAAIGRTRVGRGLPDIIHGPQSRDSRVYNNGLKNEYEISNAQRQADIRAGLSPAAAGREQADDYRSMLERQIPDGWLSVMRPGSPVVRAGKDVPASVSTEEGFMVAKAGTTRGEIAAAKAKPPTP
jgi:hypothetical protein